MFELKGEVETRLRPYWYAQNTLMGSLFRGRLPANWRKQETPRRCDATLSAALVRFMLRKQLDRIPAN